MRNYVTWLTAFGLLLGSGCSICPPGYLDDYATVGGKWQRSDPATGRVGSIFSDPGSTVDAGQASIMFDDAPGESIYEGENNLDGEYYDLDESVYQSSEPTPEYISSGQDIDDSVIILGEQW